MILRGTTPPLTVGETQIISDGASTHVVALNKLQILQLDLLVFHFVHVLLSSNARVTAHLPHFTHELCPRKRNELLELWSESIISGMEPTACFCGFMLASFQKAARGPGNEAIVAAWSICSSSCDPHASLAWPDPILHVEGSASIRAEWARMHSSINILTDRGTDTQ